MTSILHSILYKYRTGIFRIFQISNGQCFCFHLGNITTYLRMLLFVFHKHRLQGGAKSISLTEEMLLQLQVHGANWETQSRYSLWEHSLFSSS